MIKQILHLICRIKKRHAQHTNKFSLFVEQRHAVDNERGPIGETAQLPQLHLTRLQYCGNPRCRDKFGNVTAQSIFGVQAEIFGIGSVDEADYSFRVTNKSSRGQIIHSHTDKSTLQRLLGHIHLRLPL